jgi:hypothetical protein
MRSLKRTTTERNLCRNMWRKRPSRLLELHLGGRLSTMTPSTNLFLCKLLSLWQHRIPPTSMQIHTGHRHFMRQTKDAKAVRATRWFLRSQSDGRKAMDPMQDRIHQTLRKEISDVRLDRDQIESCRHRKVAAGFELSGWWTPRRRWLYSGRTGTDRTGIDSVWHDLSGVCLARQENQSTRQDNQETEMRKYHDEYGLACDLSRRSRSKNIKHETIGLIPQTRKETNVVSTRCLPGSSFRVR